MVVKWWSNGGQTVVKRWSNGGPTAANWRPNGGQMASGQWPVVKSPWSKTHGPSVAGAAGAVTGGGAPLRRALPAYERPKGGQIVVKWWSNGGHMMVV